MFFCSDTQKWVYDVFQSDITLWELQRPSTNRCWTATYSWNAHIRVTGPSLVLLWGTKYKFWSTPRNKRPCKAIIHHAIIFSTEDSAWLSTVPTCVVNLLFTLRLKVLTGLDWNYQVHQNSIAKRRSPLSGTRQVSPEEHKDDGTGRKALQENSRCTAHWMILTISKADPLPHRVQWVFYIRNCLIFYLKHTPPITWSSKMWLILFLPLLVTSCLETYFHWRPSVMMLGTNDFPSLNKIIFIDHKQPERWQKILN